MSKATGTLNSVIKVVFVLLLGLLTLSLQLLLLIIFVPVATWYIWRLSERNAILEKRVAALEGHPAAKTDKD